MFKKLRRHPEKPALLSPGERAPDFQLEASTGETIALADLRGKPVILAFYPADFSPVCGSQMALYNEALPMFEEYGGQLVGISVDSVATHREFSQAQSLRFPLLADDDPQGEMARKYRVYDESRRRAQRGLYVLDPEGIVQWSHLSPIGVNPGADGILRALEDLKERRHVDR